MNFLERRAIARATRGLKHLMAPGEQILDFDVGRMGNAPAHVVASNKAIYIRMGGTLSRTPYKDFYDIADAGGLWGIFFRTWSGSEMQFFPGRGPRPGLMAVVDEQMAKHATHEKTVDYPDGGRVRWRRRIAPDGTGVWQIRTFDLDEEPDGEWMKQTTLRLSHEFGLVDEE